MSTDPNVQQPNDSSGYPDYGESTSRRFNPARLMKEAIRNSPWFVIGVMLNLLALAVMSIFYISKPGKNDTTSVTTVGLAAHKDETVQPANLPPEVIDRKAIPKNTEAEVVTYEEDIFVPSSVAPSDADADLSMKVGDPTALNLPSGGATGGTGIGVGVGGHQGTGRPSAFASRRAGGGGGRAAGQTQGTEEAVLEGLRWLMRHQNPDGSWNPEKLIERCLPESPCVKKEDPMNPDATEGLTGLALLAFLGAGYSNESKQTIVDPILKKRVKIGDTVKKGLVWLKDHQKEDGSFSDSREFMMYNEALDTLALCEAYGLTRNRIWQEPAQKAVNFLVNAQRPNPSGKGMWGWRYRTRVDIEKEKPEAFADQKAEAAYKKLLYDADTSVTCWVIMALKSAQLADLDVPQAALDGALDFVKWATPQNGDGLVGYLTPEGAGGTIGGPGDEYDYHVATMSALGMCVRTFIEHNPSDPFLDLAAKQLLKDLPVISKDKLSIDYYYWYYGSLALNQLDGPDSPRKTGKYWGPWNKAMQESILSLQDKTEKACSKGGWITPDRWCHGTGPLYTTAINVLTLEVYYRYENAFGGAKSLKVKAAEKAATEKPAPEKGKAPEEGKNG
ncbi:MAG: hypothetical protein HYR85_16390 [Planctomycetes bacterium]|nr:hypothetical protein [Planctomycetota bacterium]MBI3845086.1 hypothetical protein [Planctomycetota bacterium]